MESDDRLCSCVLSKVAPSYAALGRALISVGLSDRLNTSAGDLPQVVQTFLRAWFGPAVDAWRHLRTDRIRSALPPVDLLQGHAGAVSQRLDEGLYLCGDYRESGTFEGALLSGRKAADAVMADYAARHTGVMA